MSRGRRIATVLLGVVLVSVLAVWVASIVLRPKFPEPSAIAAGMQQQAALSGGARVYSTHCAYCHDTGFGPSIAGRGLAVTLVGTFVRSGPGAMQAFTPAQVSNADIESVTDFVNGLKSVPAKGS